MTGGDIIEVTWSNPILGAGFLFPVSGADSTYDLGGFRVNDQTVLDGAGRQLIQLNRMPWSFQVEVANDMVNTEEFDSMSALAASGTESTWTFANINGQVYRGTGVIQGGVQLNGNKGTFVLKVGGGGTMGKQ